MFKKIVTVTIGYLLAPEWVPVLATITAFAGTVIAVKKAVDEFSKEKD